MADVLLSAIKYLRPPGEPRGMKVVKTRPMKTLRQMRERRTIHTLGLPAC